VAKGPDQRRHPEAWHCRTDSAPGLSTLDVMCLARISDTLPLSIGHPTTSYLAMGIIGHFRFFAAPADGGCLVQTPTALVEVGHAWVVVSHRP
jgi:hypothetical protein